MCFAFPPLLRPAGSASPATVAGGVAAAFCCRAASTLRGMGVRLEGRAGRKEKPVGTAAPGAVPAGVPQPEPAAAGAVPGAPLGAAAVGVLFSADSSSKRGGRSGLAWHEPLPREAGGEWQISEEDLVGRGKDER